jgi:purine-binding chemotaxis protein CheW
VDKETNVRSEQILDLAAQRRREKQVVDVEVEKTLIVVFHLSGPSPAGPSSSTTEHGLYGLPASDVESIVEIEKITYVPGTPPWILGVVNVRGEIESVLDLKAVLELDPTENTPESRLLIAQDGELRSGLLVDRVVDIAYIPVMAISPPPAPLEKGKGVYIAGETEYREQTLVILDLAEIFQRALETDQV